MRLTLASSILSDGGAHATEAPGARGFRVAGWDAESKNPDDAACDHAATGSSTVTDWRERKVDRFDLIRIGTSL